MRSVLQGDESFSEPKQVFEGNLKALRLNFKKSEDDDDLDPSDGYEEFRILKSEDGEKWEQCSDPR
jgi:hypothetical protein